jgi:hypothetical protein
MPIGQCHRGSGEGVINTSRYGRSKSSMLFSPALAKLIEQLIARVIAHGPDGSAAIGSSEEAKRVACDPLPRLLAKFVVRAE